jgi:hypothetical protein
VPGLVQDIGQINISLNVHRLINAKTARVLAIICKSKRAVEKRIRQTPGVAEAIKLPQVLMGVNDHFKETTKLNYAAWSFATTSEITRLSLEGLQPPFAVERPDR